MEPDATLDAGASGCGELTMLIARAVRALAPGQLLDVRAYDLAAGLDIPAAGAGAAPGALSRRLPETRAARCRWR